MCNVPDDWAGINTGDGMIDIFYRLNGKILASQSAKDFVNLRRENVVWIDLLSPSGEEKQDRKSVV